MKNIPMKTSTVTIAGQERPLVYAQLARDAVSFIHPRVGGMTIAEQRARIRVLDCLDFFANPTAEGATPQISLALEDQDAATLKACLEALPLTVIDKSLVAAMDELIAACT